MKTNLIKLITHPWLIIFGIALIFTGCDSDDNMSALDDIDFKYGNTQGQKGGCTDCACIMDLPFEDLSQEEIHALEFMLEEEKMARDVYHTMFDLYDAQIFSKISSSEQKHMDAILCLFEKYELECETTIEDVGVFTNPAIQELYNDLIDMGSVDYTQALMAGALIEETDILDLIIHMEQDIDNEDLSMVFQNLLKGSENHLRAFVSALSKVDITYEPVILDQTYFDEILAGQNGNKGQKGFKGDKEKNHQNGDTNGQNGNNGNNGGGNGNGNNGGSGGNGGGNG